MRGGRILLIVGIFGVLLAVIIGGVLVMRSLTSTSAPPPDDGQAGATSEPIQTGIRQIVVAAQDIIPRGHRITEEEGAVELVPWPENALPEGYLFELTSVYGRVTRMDIRRGMPVTEGMLTEEGGDLDATGSDAALMIPSGRVGYAIAAAGNASVAWAIEPGDHVDVLISLLTAEFDEEFQSEMPNLGLILNEDGTITEVTMGEVEALPDGRLIIVAPDGSQSPRLITQLTVQNARVLHVGSWVEQEVVATPVPEAETEEEAAEPPPPPLPLVRWVTLAITPQEAAVLKYVEEAGASIDFVLRSFEDHSDGTQFSIQAVTLSYIFERYSIEVPPKLPYGVSPPAATLRKGAAGEIQREIGSEEEFEYSRSKKVVEEVPVPMD
jgi:Flp pilus assembly protein CpaB